MAAQHPEQLGPVADGIRTGNRRRVRALLLHGGLGGGGTGNFDLRFAAAAVDGDLTRSLWVLFRCAPSQLLPGGRPLTPGVYLALIALFVFTAADRRGWRLSVRRYGRGRRH